ncbi:MAG: thioredoxin domain-containing protein [Bacteriovoracaceae bacterium]|nr:thioredoxin domain-containing protein [Bacteriovoracaceae bacterium]
MSHTFAVCKNCHSVNRIQIARAGEAVCGKCQAKIPFHGLVSDVTEADFRKLLKVSDKPLIVDFWASWCGPCQMYGPEFQKASMENDKAVFLKVNTETETALSGSLGIRGIPCTIIFKDGKEVKRQSGAMNAAGVNSLLTQI